jgi:fatty acid desaturase
MNMNGLWAFIGVAIVILTILAGNWGFLLLIILGVIGVFALSHFFQQYDKKKGGYEARAKAENSSGNTKSVWKMRYYRVF